MRWSIVRVIWLRELRDQLRDRRTLFMIVVLPLLIYPLGGFGLMQMTARPSLPVSAVGVVGAEHLPAADEALVAGARSAAAWLTLATSQPLSGVERAVAALAPLEVRQRHAPFPPLLAPRAGGVQFSPAYLNDETGRDSIRIFLLRGSADPNRARALLDEYRLDLVLVVPPDFAGRLGRDGRPSVSLVSRPGDDRSGLASYRVNKVLARWKEQVKETRFRRLGLPGDFDRPFEVRDPVAARFAARGPAGEIVELLLMVFPFVLVMWSLAGALYPAVDLCAGEKERGTMETLLISPARREEIVWGKFLAIWVFSGATALLNLASIGVTSWLIGSQFAPMPVSPLGLLWGVALSLPLSAFFSALCLAVGAYARSTKEGQYYLMPLFLVVMPLMFLTLAPGVELNPFYSMVPVTGVSLLLQRLMAAGTPDASLWLYFIPVLAPMVIYGWLALRWAIFQFQREEVLFREAEQLEVGLWLRRLLREKEPRPSAAQALTCFVLAMALGWFSLGLGGDRMLTGLVRFVAFVAAPALLMAVLLTTQPRQSLALRLPPGWAWPMAVSLGLVLTPLFIELTLLPLQQDPGLRKRLVEQYRPATEWLAALRRDGPYPAPSAWLALAVFAWLPAVCEELAFRGFILTGLQRRFRPRTAVLLSSFLFALLHMNVFQVLPAFLLGVVLGYLTTRCGSVLPPMILHMVYNTLLLIPSLGKAGSGPEAFLGLSAAQRITLMLGCAVLAAVLLLRLSRFWPHAAYVAFLWSDPDTGPPPARRPRRGPKVREMAT